MIKKIFFSLILLMGLAPIVVLGATTLPSKYVMINAINWQSLNNLPVGNGSEFTYFVLTVDANGNLLGGNSSIELKFVSDVHAGGKKASFSVGGGTQNVSAITSAVNNPSFIQNIVNHVNQFGYDGVTLDIENTSIDSQAMADFINALRGSLDQVKPGIIIGLHVQPYQRTTVWSKLGQAMNAITWVSPMLYDSGKFKLSTAVDTMNLWSAMVPKSKLLAGLAVNYPTANGGLSTSVYGQMLDAVISNGWRGVAIWNNYLYTQPWVKITSSKISVE